MIVNLRQLIIIGVKIRIILIGLVKGYRYGYKDKRYC